MKNLLLYLLFFCAILSFSVSCIGEDVANHPSDVDSDGMFYGINDSIELAADEMTILRTMDGNSPKIS